MAYETDDFTTMPVPASEFTSGSGFSSAESFCGESGYFLIQVIQVSDGDPPALEFEVIETHCKSGHVPPDPSFIKQVNANRHPVGQIFAVCCEADDSSSSSSS